jgi:hypothetical protein
MKRLAAFLISTALLAFTATAFAQPSAAVQSISPLSRDLPAALVTLTAQGAGTVNSADQTGYNVSRVTCVFRESVSGGTPSSTFAIQGKDFVSGQYYTILTSAAITTNSVNPIYVGAGVSTAANVSSGVPIPRVWRVTTTVGGTTPAVTATIGCSVQ